MEMNGVAAMLLGQKTRGRLEALAAVTALFHEDYDDDRSAIAEGRAVTLAFPVEAHVKIDWKEIGRFHDSLTRRSLYDNAGLLLICMVW